MTGVTGAAACQRAKDPFLRRDLTGSLRAVELFWGLGVITANPEAGPAPGSALLPRTTGSYPLTSAGSMEGVLRTTAPAPPPEALP